MKAAEEWRRKNVRFAKVHSFVRKIGLRKNTGKAGRIEILLPREQAWRPGSADLQVCGLPAVSVPALAAEVPWSDQREEPQGLKPANFTRLIAGLKALRHPKANVRGPIRSLSGLPRGGWQGAGAGPP